MKAESVPEAVELMKNGDPRGICSRAEHGARVSRTSKAHTAENPQKCNRAKSTQRKANETQDHKGKKHEQSEKDGRHRGYYINIRPIKKGKRNRAI